MSDSEWCNACRSHRPLSDLIAVVSVARPSEIGYVCRPTLDRGGFQQGSCFRMVVGSVFVHKIAAAEAVTTRPAAALLAA